MYIRRWRTGERAPPPFLLASWAHQVGTGKGAGWVAGPAPEAQTLEATREEGQKITQAPSQREERRGRALGGSGKVVLALNRETSTAPFLRSRCTAVVLRILCSDEKGLPQSVCRDRCALACCRKERIKEVKRREEREQELTVRTPCTGHIFAMVCLPSFSFHVVRCQWR